MKNKYGTSVLSFRLPKDDAGEVYTEKAKYQTWDKCVEHGLNVSNVGSIYRMYLELLAINEDILKKGIV